MTIQQRVSILVMAFLLSGTLWGMKKEIKKSKIAQSGMKQVIQAAVLWKCFQEKISQSENNEQILENLLNSELPIQKIDAKGNNAREKIESLIDKLLEKNQPKLNSSLKEFKSAVNILKKLKNFFKANMTV